jgi:hypothetical protein
MAKTVFDVLDEKIVAQQRDFEDHLNSGGAKDFAEYRNTCGVIRGLAIARRELSDLLRAYKDQDDD